MARILLVEDYPPLAKVVAIALARAGHEVERAGGVGRALETAERFDAMVVDIDLPDGNGIDVAERMLREHRVGFVVFFSATRDPDARARALRLGPFIEKSEAVDTVTELIGEELASRAELAQCVGAPGRPSFRNSARSGTRRRVR